MKKVGVLLVLFVFFSLVWTGSVKQVKAARVEDQTYTVWSGSVSWDTPIDISNWTVTTTNSTVKVAVQITSTKFAFAVYLKKDDMTYIKLIVTQDGSSANIYIDSNHWDQNAKELNVTWGTGTHYILFDFKNGTVNVYLDGYNDVAKTMTTNFDVVNIVELRKEGGADDSWYSTTYIKQIDVTITKYYYDVSLSLKDALTGQPLSGVTVKEGSNVLGTIDDGRTLELTKGTHTLTFEKSGYWSVTKTIDVQGDMTVSVELYPDSAAFMFKNFPNDIRVYENSIYELTFTLSPISTQATYNTYLSLSGLTNVLEVRKNGQLVSPESGKYYLGDISGPTQVSIKFKAGAVGTHGFTLTLTSNDAMMSKTYTTTKTVTYTVEPLPFSVQMPSEWQVGQNELRISESSGQSYLITAVLKDSNGNEVWSDSYAFSPYEAYTFQVNIPSEGSYTLELTWNGMTAIYDITVNPAITLVTKTLTVSEGGEGVITLHFKNPSSSVQYYTIKVGGGFLTSEVNQSVAIAPLTEKDVSIAFAVPEDLTYDAYELQVQVLQGDAVVFQDKVAVTIGDSEGFSLFGSGGSGSTWLWIFGGLLVVGLGIWALRRR